MEKKPCLNLGQLQVPEITQSTVMLIGGKGTGKTNTLKMCGRRLADDYRELTIIAIDVLNVMYIKGFDRLLVDRKNAGRAKELAAILNKTSRSRVIISFVDLLQGEQNGFINELFANLRLTDTVFLLDEIHDIVPQSGENYCHEVERAIRHWRNKNIGFIGTSQRPAKVNKNVYELSDVLVVYRIVGNNDRKAIEGYIGGLLPRERVDAIMADVQTLGFLQAYVLNFR